VCLLDGLSGKKQQQQKATKQKQPPAPARNYPTRSIIGEKDLKTLADFKRYYPLPDGVVYAQTAEGVPVVERQADGETFNFLVEEGLMGFDVPRARSDGRAGKRTIEAFKQT
jgi:hypothetical protein